MKLSKEDVRLLSLVYMASGSLDAFTLYRRSRLTYVRFTGLIEKLTKNELLIYRDNKFELSEEAKELLHQNKNYLIEKVKSWRRVPKEFVTDNIYTDTMYVPSRSRLDSRQFKKNLLE